MSIDDRNCNLIREISRLIFDSLPCHVDYLTLTRVLIHNYERAHCLLVAILGLIKAIGTSESARCLDYNGGRIIGGFNVMNNTSLIPGPKKLPAMAGWSARRGGR